MSQQCCLLKREPKYLLVKTKKSFYYLFVKYNFVKCKEYSPFFGGGWGHFNIITGFGDLVLAGFGPSVQPPLLQECRCLLIKETAAWGGSRKPELLLVICTAIKQCPKNAPLSFLFHPLPLFFTAFQQHLLHVWWAGGAVRALEYKIFFFAQPLENPGPSQNNSLWPTV